MDTDYKKQVMHSKYIPESVKQFVLEKIAEMTGNIAFLSKLKEIPNMTLKYVVTNQSLYV